MGNYISVYFMTRVGQKMPERLNIYEFSAKIIAIVVYNG